MFDHILLKRMCLASNNYSCSLIRVQYISKNCFYCIVLQFFFIFFLLFTVFFILTQQQNEILPFQPFWFGNSSTRSHIIFIRFGERIYWLHKAWKSDSHLAASHTPGMMSLATDLFIRKHYGSMVCHFNHQLWPT